MKAGFNFTSVGLVIGDGVISASFRN